ncbi:MAG: hypothetical protein ACI9JO_000405, partial [Psychrobacter okhotskensis]
MLLGSRQNNVLNTIVAKIRKVFCLVATINQIAKPLYI